MHNQTIEFSLPGTCDGRCTVVKGFVSWKLIWVVQIAELGHFIFTSEIYIARRLYLAVSNSHVAQISAGRLIG